MLRELLEEVLALQSNYTSKKSTAMERRGELIPKTMRLTHCCRTIGLEKVSV
jgi:hypothetical protein